MKITVKGAIATIIAIVMIVLVTACGIFSPIPTNGRMTLLFDSDGGKAVDCG